MGLEGVSLGQSQLELDGAEHRAAGWGWPAPASLERLRWARLGPALGTPERVCRGKVLVALGQGGGCSVRPCLVLCPWALESGSGPAVPVPLGLGSRTPCVCVSVCVSAPSTSLALLDSSWVPPFPEWPGVEEATVGGHRETTVPQPGAVPVPLRVTQVASVPSRCRSTQPLLPRVHHALCVHMSSACCARQAGVGHVGRAHLPRPGGPAPTWMPCVSCWGPLMGHTPLPEWIGGLVDWCWRPVVLTMGGDSSGHQAVRFPVVRLPVSWVQCD